MSEETITTTEETKTMTREELMAHEHKIQTGETNILPDGRTVDEAWTENLRLQAEQEEALRERGKQWADLGREQSPKTGEDFLKEKVEVRVSDSGAISARPVKTEADVDLSGGDPPTVPNDLPADFPSRDALYAAGVTFALVKTLDKDALLELKGIGEASADKILAYLQAE